MSKTSVRFNQNHSICIKQDHRTWPYWVALSIKYPRLELQVALNPLTPMSDQDRISPYSIDSISTR